MPSKVIAQAATWLCEPTEEALEALCAFMFTIGPEFDKEKWTHRDSIDKAFEHLEELVTRDFISTRLKFVAQETIASRSSGWTRGRGTFGISASEDGICANYMTRRKSGVIYRLDENG